MTWVQGNVDKLQYWANGANLILSTCKTKYMLLSSCKCSSHHELNNTKTFWDLDRPPHVRR